MKKIEINNDVIYVPESWDDIKLGFYETWFHKVPKDRKEHVELVAEICKTGVDKLLGYPEDVYNIIAGILNFVFTETKTEPSPCIEIGGKKYIIPIAEKLTLGAWVDAEAVQNEKTNVLTGILAITCLEEGEKYDAEKYEERRNMFAELTVSRALPLLCFFLHYRIALEKRTSMFSKVTEAAGHYLSSIKSFPGIGGGTRLSRIWRAVRYYALTKWNCYQLRKCLRSLDSR